jgi:dolichyl-diphosphooligosaccharide--protein glycosyltransferase/undecaprenyl-diphosphooligosaccharide--protein glycosyltransferase
MNGAKGKQAFFFISKNFQDDGEFIHLGRGVSVNKKSMDVSIGSSTVKLKRFVKTAYTLDKKNNVEEQLIHPKSDISLIYMSSYNIFLLVDEKVYNSLYIQLMILDKYDKQLFEKVIDDPYAKVFKLKV